MANWNKMLGMGKKAASAMLEEAHGMNRQIAQRETLAGDIDALHANLRNSANNTVGRRAAPEMLVGSERVGAPKIVGPQDLPGAQMDLFGAGDIPAPIAQSKVTPFVNGSGSFRSAKTGRFKNVGKTVESQAEAARAREKTLSNMPGDGESQLTVPFGKQKAGDTFHIGEGDAPWKQVMKAGGNSLVNAFDGMGGKDFMRNVIRHGGGPVAGAAIGAGIGAVGGVLAPGNMESGNFVQSAFKGAAMGGALGIAHKFSSGAHAFAMNSLGKDAANAAWMQKSLGITKKVTGSAVTMAALSAASAGGSLNTNFTRPVNGAI